MNNLEYIDKRLAEQKELSKQAAENADEKAWALAENEIKALTEMRKFYEKEASRELEEGKTVKLSSLPDLQEEIKHKLDSGLLSVSGRW